MGSFNLLTALRAAAGTFTARQSFDTEQALKKIAAPVASLAGYTLVYVDTTDNRLKGRSDAGTVRTLDVTALSELTGLDEDRLPNVPYTPGRAQPQQEIVASTIPGGRLILWGSTDPTNPGDVALGNVLLVDLASGIVGVGDVDPVPGAGVLQTAGAVRINNALDPDNLVLRCGLAVEEAHGTIEAGILPVYNETTGEILGIPLFRRAGVVPPVTTQKAFSIRWTLAGATVNPADTFPQANGTLAGAVSSSGHTWTVHAGGFQVASNQVQCTGGTAPLGGAVHAAATLGSVAGLRHVSVTLVNAGTGNAAPGVLYRYDPTTDSGYVLVAMKANGNYIFAFWNGASNYTGTQTVAHAPVDGELVELIHNGDNTMTARLGGTSYSLTGTHTNNASSNAHGIFKEGTTDNATVRYDGYQTATS